MENDFKAGDLVFTEFKNRWDLKCVGEIRELKEKIAIVEVFNIHGPGANCDIEIPIEKLTKACLVDGQLG